MKDDFFNYLVATDQVDDFLGYEPKSPTCEQKLTKLEDNYYCENCDKLYDNNIEEVDENNRYI